MNVITLDGKTIYRANDFTLKKEYIFAGEYTTCTGATIADCVGWKYADCSLSWDTIPQSQLDDLLELNGRSVVMTWTDADGEEKEENVIPLTHSYTATRFFNNGVAVWRDIQLELRFIDAHSNE